MWQPIKQPAGQLSAPALGPLLCSAGLDTFPDVQIIKVEWAFGTETQKYTGIFQFLWVVALAP